MNRASKKKLLRQGTAKELVGGGVWYYKDAKGDFKTVISDLDWLGMPIKDYREFCKRCARLGFLYLNREKPNYCLTESQHKADFRRIEKYKK